MTWLDKLLPPRIKRASLGAKRVPEGLWVKCPACDAVLYGADLEGSLGVCPKCSHHLRIRARRRIDSLLDAEGRYEIGQEVLPVDALTVVGAAFEFEFMAGSMGSVVGERFVRGVQAAIDQKVPFISVAASGGARMQEGVLSLMQMAKTSAMLAELAERRLPYISVLTDPTMGGVSASFCFLGDVVIAEPKALIGFAGPRVIEQTVREKLPEGFQRAEFLLEKGAIDLIIDRREMRDEIARLLALMLRQPSESLA